MFRRGAVGYTLDQRAWWLPEATHWLNGLKFFLFLFFYSFSWDTQLMKNSPIALRVILRGSPGLTA